MKRFKSFLVCKDEISKISFLGYSSYVNIGMFLFCIYHTIVYWQTFFLSQIPIGRTNDCQMMIETHYNRSIFMRQKQEQDFHQYDEISLSISEFIPLTLLISSKQLKFSCKTIFLFTSKLSIFARSDYLQ